MRTAKQDELCGLCPIKKKCPGNCLLLNWIGKLNIRIEPLVEDLKVKALLDSKNYNDDLAELISDRQAKINRCLEFTDVKKRAIAILLLAGISQKEISELFSMSYRQINRIVNKSI
jgi:hypothetical protein